MNDASMFRREEDVAAAAALRSDRFRLEREGDWLRLERIVEQMEKGRPGRIADDEVRALPTLYRTLMSSLSIARESSLDAGLIAYLEGLALRAYYLVYGTRTSFGAWCKGFFGGALSRAVRSIGPDLLIAFACMIAGAIVGYLLVAHDTDWFYSLVPAQFGDVRVPGASEEVLRSTLFDTGAKSQDGLTVFATSLFSNNAQVAILAFALGFAFGVPSMLLLVHNMALLGAMMWVFVQRGLGMEFVGWLSIHGTTEMFAILLAGAAGIHIGRSLGFPGQRSHLAVMREAGQRGAQVMVGVIVMLLCAGLLEGFARQLINNTGARYAIGYSILAFWLVYYFLFARKRAV
ncbi:MAG: stage II sporulation protein M [Blastomonas sp.]